MATIAIIGGGIGGLTTALTLQHFGFEATVYEQSPAFREVGAAISVWPNALRVYKALGLLEQVLANSGEFSAAYIRTASGKILSRTRPSYELPSICMHRADLLGVLLQQVPERQLKPGHKLASFTREQDKWLLQFENGHQTTCDLLIGADGINSVVRQQLLSDGAPIYRGYNIWRGVARLSIEAGYGSETMGKGARVGIVPIKDGQFGWWAALNEPLGQTDEPEGTRNKLKRLFGSWHDPIPALFDNTEEILKNPVGDRLPTKGWSRDRAVLLGDAAHPTTPNLGQGACMAIEGAWLLAATLAKYGLTDQALARYEALHFPRTKDVTENSLMIGKVGQQSSTFATGLRNLVFSLMPSSFTMKQIDKYFGYDVTRVQV
jgi:2-polyprenyl-6-methoxyphenol hydroxylase-like FAD-dependent oxidoreductase